MGKVKVAPSHGHSMPRLELCAAVLSVELHDIIIGALKTRFHDVRFHTDSKVVLGYISNRTRRFFMYVSNRVERIRQSSDPSQWFYIASKHNPADCATRSVPAADLQASLWLRGPSAKTHFGSANDYPLVDPEQDKELKVEVSVLTTKVSTNMNHLSDKFAMFDTWISLLRTVSSLIHVLRSFKSPNEECRGWHLCYSSELPENSHAAELAILRTLQRDYFSDEVNALEHGNSISRHSSLYQLDPYIDDDGLVRVGGRLSYSKLSDNEKFLILLPKNHPASLLLVSHYHQKVHHQGRQITEGALRSAGYWIIGEKKLISNVIHRCIPCRKLRAKPLDQKMADLPIDRLTPAPPFTFVGVDVFGPWKIVYRRTRGSQVNPKRWAVLFTCLAIRAIHIEVIEEMTSSSFINALRRFTSIRGPVKELRSDCGSNFIGSVIDLQANVINVDDPKTSAYLNSQGITWKFNPPHSSHMGGVWERMIGVSRRILDSLLSDVPGNSLTHEVLVTFMCEVMAIVNARPLVPVSNDPDNPLVLSPSVILTQKTKSDVQTFTHIHQSDMYKTQWKKVQVLAEKFWKRWSREFLQTLQKRRKWETDSRNLQDGDVVLMRDSNLPRNEWPIGLVVQAIKNDDGYVRKARIRIVRDGTPKEFVRPISELVYLFSDSE